MRSCADRRRTCGQPVLPDHATGRRSALYGANSEGGSYRNRQRNASVPAVLLPLDDAQLQQRCVGLIDLMGVYSAAQMI